MLEAGTKIGAYRIDRRLGEGGMGEVYAAFDETAETAVALKVLSSDAEKDKEAVGRFKREASALQAFKNHPGVVRVLDFDRTADGVVYLVMELLEGRTLAEWIRNQREPIVLEDALTIARQIAETMADVHDADVIHRDLKPGNVMLVSDEKERLGMRPKIFDFGIAKVHLLTGDDEQATTLPKTRGFIGTPRYAAPEQAMPGKANTDKIDVYALGLILYEMLAGKRLFESEDGFEEIYKRHNIEPGMLSELLPRVPRGLAELMGEMLAKRPEDRPTMRACAEMFAFNWEERDAQPEFRARHRTHAAESASTRTTHVAWARWWPILRAVMMVAAIAVVGAAWHRERQLAARNREDAVQSCKKTLDVDWDLRLTAGHAQNRLDLLTGCDNSLRNLVQSDPTQIRGVLIKTKHQLSDWQKRYGTLKAAYEYLSGARELIDAGKKEDPSSDEMRILEAMHFSKHGKLLLIEREWADARREFSTSIRLLEQPSTKAREVAPDLATSLSERGDAEWLSGHPADAIEWYDQAIPLRAKIAASSDDTYDRVLVADALVHRARALLALRRMPDASNAFNEALQWQDSIAQSEPNQVYFQMVWLEIHLGLAHVDREVQQWQAAQKKYDFVVQHAGSLHAADPEHKEIGLLLIESLDGVEFIAEKQLDSKRHAASHERRCDIARRFLKKDPRDKRFDLKKCG